MRITSLGYRPVNQASQNYKNNSAPQFKGQIIIKNAEGDALERLIAQVQRLLRFYNRNFASNAKLDYSLENNGRKIEFDVETPFKITREGNVLKFPTQPPNPIKYKHTIRWYDKVAIRTKDILNKALLKDAERTGRDLSTVPQLEFVPD